jgi:hypothetical protein
MQIFVSTFGVSNEFLVFSIFLLLADYGVDKYDIGDGFGHFGIAVEDVSYSFLTVFACPVEFDC